MYDAELIETKKKVDELLSRKEFSYKTGLKEGYLDAVSDLVNKIKETDDFEYAMFSLGFIKEAAEQLIKEMWDGDISMKKLGAYKQGRADKYQEIVSEYMLLTEKQVADIRADAIDEVRNKMFSMPAFLTVDDVMRILDELKEQK